MRTRSGLVWQRLALLGFVPAVICASGNARAQSMRDLFDRTKASVVVVHTESRELVNGDGEHDYVSSGGLGSGVYVGNKHVVTAAHVVETSEKVSVEFSGGQIVNARVESSVPYGDVALLVIEWVPTSAIEAVIGDSDLMAVGDQVYVVGAPYGLSYSLTVGHISSRQAPGDKISGLIPIELFQTDAAINTGNSGGPMFNMNGEVIGIVSYILTRSGGFEGLGFAVTSNVARRLLFDEDRGWTGIEAVFLTEEYAAMLNVPQGVGLLVESVASGGLGSQLGLRGGTIKSVVDDQDVTLGGDIVLSVNGIEVTDSQVSLESIHQSMGDLGPGSELRVTVLRAGEVLELSTVVQR